MADGSITYQTAPECPFCEGDNIDDGGFCLRCKERVRVYPTPQPALRKPPLYSCVGCDVPTYLCDMNDDMQCSECGEADDEEFEDTSWAAMRREHGTWSV